MATPLVFSVHSVVSWDFRDGAVPGWQLDSCSRPNFVAGAIFSGVALVDQPADRDPQGLNKPSTS